MGQEGSDLYNRQVTSKKECCGVCWADTKCKAADFHNKICHVKAENKPVPRKDGSVSCLALKNATEAAQHWALFD